MPTALLILAAILPADGPPRVPADTRQATLAELVSDAWSGEWKREGWTIGGARLQRGILTTPLIPPVRRRARG